MKPGSGKKVVVAMSGGVDSSVAAALLQQQGYEVVGCFMRLGEEESRSPESCVLSPESKARSPESCVLSPESKAGDKAQSLDSGPRTQDSRLRPQDSPRPNRQGCCSVNDAADARLVAAMLGIPFYVLNFRQDFGRIKDYFTAEYNAGRTPNPCVRCNDWLKFGKLFDYARSIDADYIATGHYAQVVRTESPAPNNSPAPNEPPALNNAPKATLAPPHPRPRLLRGIDHHKDQSYVLFGLKRDRLERMLLPIGALTKPTVRKIAQDLGLPVFDKPDSFEICFIPDNDYRGYLHRRSPESFQPGTLVDTAGQVIGEHEGHQHFTVGQRRGLPVNASYPLYVVNKDAATNVVVLGRREEVNSLGCRADQVNWLIDQPPVSLPASPPASSLAVTVKIRSNSDPVPARVIATGADTLEVRFDEPQHAVTPGQAVVCYDGDELICGGWITEAL